MLIIAYLHYISKQFLPNFADNVSEWVQNACLRNKKYGPLECHLNRSFCSLVSSLQHAILSNQKSNNILLVHFVIIYVNTQGLHKSSMLM